MADGAQDGLLMLRGSGGANRSMEAEFKRVIRRAVPDRNTVGAKKLDTQTLAYPFRPEWAWAAVHYLRTPSRVLWHLASVDARRLEPLYDEIVAALRPHPADWAGGCTRLSVEVRRMGDFPAGPLQVRGAVKSAIIEAARLRGHTMTLAPDDPQLLFAVEVRDDAVWLGIDLAGRSLHQRGYRKARGEAPLRENVAAQLLMLARWDPRREALIDPMAGSGTIAIEGAAMAQARPIWCDGFIPLAAGLAPIEPHVRRVMPPLFADAKPPIIANEINTDTLEALRGNIMRAQVRERVEVVHGDFRDLRPDRIHQIAQTSTGGLIIVNPPYGQRAEGKGAAASRRDEARDSPSIAGHSDEEIAELYNDLRRWWLDLGPGWRLGILSDHPSVTTIFGRRTTLEKPVSNGPLKAWFRVYAPETDS